MLSDLPHKIVDASCEGLFLAGVAVVIGALLSAMYIVCAAQVQFAQARHASAQTQRQAVMDCLDSDPRASYTACAGAVRSQVSAMVPVAYYSR